MIRAPSLCGALCIFVVGCASAPRSAPAPTASPAPVASRGSAPTPEAREAAPAVVSFLLDEGHWSFHEDGRLEQRYVVRYRIERAEALESGYASASATWAPWHQARPELEVSVTHPDGRSFSLDPATIEESGAGGSDPLMYSDQRTLRAALPGLKVGAVVEVRRRYVDTAPSFTGGSAPSFQVGAHIPVEKMRLTVEAPEQLPLTYRVRGMELAPEETVADGRRTLRFAVDDLEPVPLGLPDTTPELVQRPFIQVSANAGWPTIASAYADAVAEAVAGADLATIAAPEASGRLETVAALTAAVHRQVRYTGLELGQGALVPTRPEVTLERGYGDCKDKSTLLVALLARAGIEAQLALVRSGYTVAIDPTLASIEVFDHAIVHVPGTPELWIDATNPLQPVDQLPAGLSGKQVLLASKHTTGLVRIPERANADNHYVERRVIELDVMGPTRVKEIMSGRGPRGWALRERYEDVPEARIREQLTPYISNTYGAEGSIESMQGGSSSEAPYAFTLSVLAPALQATFDTAEIPLSYAAIFDGVPDSAFDEKRREHDLYIWAPYTMELLHEVQLPRGFEVVKVPEAATLEWGPATLTRSFEQSEGQVLVRYAFDSGPRRWKPEQVEAFTKAVKDLEPTDELLVQHRALGLRSRGRFREAIALHTAALDAHPEDPAELLRFAETLQAAGLGEAARLSAARATELAPDAWYPWYIRGSTLMGSEVGAEVGLQTDREAAKAAFERTLELNPDSAAAHLNLAVLDEYGFNGDQFGPGNRPAEAAARYDLMEKEGWDLGALGYQVNRRLILLQAGRYADAARVCEASAPDDTRDIHCVAALALSEGAPATIRWVDGLPDPGAVLLGSAALLRALGEAEALQLVVDLARPHVDLRMQRHLRTLEKADRAEAIMAEAAPPVRVALAFIRSWFRHGPQPPMDALRPWIHPDFEAEIAQAPLGLHPAATQFRATADATSRGLMWETYAAAYIMDRVPQVYQAADAGWMVRLPAKGIPTDEAYFIEVHEGVPKVRGMSSRPEGLRRAIAKIALEGRTPQAQQWLNWMGTKQTFGLSMLGHPKPATPEEALLDLGIVLSRQAPEDAKLGVALIRRLAPRLDPAQVSRRARASLELARLKKDAAGEARHLAELRAAGEVPPLKLELLAARQTSLATPPLDLSSMPLPPAMQAAAAFIAAKQGDLSGSLEVLDRLEESGDISGRGLNEYAWVVHASGSDPERAVTLAERAAEATKYESSATLHTLASAYAEAGRPQLAIKALRQSIEVAGGLVRPEDHYVLGRLAEHYGLIDEARRQYAYLEPPSAPDALDCWSIAQRQLEALE